jgi:hypothetical protein
MKRILPVLTAVILLVASGVVHGLRTDRWGSAADVQAAAARLEAVRPKLGDWESEPVKVDTPQLEAAEVVGYLSRRYKHRFKGSEVIVLVVCGRAGPISVHPPEICYQGAGYGLVEARQKYQVPGDDVTPAADLWTADFTRQGPDPDPLRVFWAWSTDGQWTAPEDPRFTFAASGVLYKLYLVRRLNKSLKEPLKEDPSLDLLQVLLPELQRCLSPSS